MDDVADLAQTLMQDDGFVADLARFKENLLTEKFIRRKYGNLDEASWSRLGESDELVAAVETESIRRTRNGQAKRERAQQHAVKIPDMAAGIAFDVAANPRHRLDAGALLDKLSANGPEAAAVDSTRFSIVINLGADVSGKEIIERYDRSIEVNPNDVDPNHTDDNKLRELFPIIVAKKDDDQ